MSEIDKKQHDPLVSYRHEIQSGKIKYDSTQEKLMLEYQKLYEKTFKVNFITKYFQNILSLFSSVEKHGFYVWGNVGRGKTHLMDIFYNAVPTKYKERIHYHSFMLQIHTELFKLHSYENPLEELAKNIIQHKKVLCIDEFFIDNIADAMIMKTLLTKILATNNILIITTNIPPQKLYENGLQRQHFVSVIACIEKYLKVINLDGNLDYRCTKLKKQDLYLTTQDKKSILKCRKLYSEFSPENVKTIKNYIEIDKHKINTIRISENAIWFSFKEICATPRSKDDYIKISKNYTIVVIINIPLFKDNNTSSLRRFITFIDELYEKKTKLILLTEEVINKLHNTEQLNFEFKRTLSRLTEMQSTEYNNTKHNGNV